ncbi:MAG: hypothetical protein WC975_00595 [Phycisphaerae bacterium]
MSRCYEVRVEVKDLSMEQVCRVMSESGWDQGFCEIQTDKHNEPYVHWGGSGSLCGGETEAEAHERFTEAFRKINPACQVRTRWLCTEYLWEKAEEFGGLE